jgi:hypothetical protein
MKEFGKIGGKFFYYFKVMTLENKNTHGYGLQKIIHW